MRITLIIMTNTIIIISMIATNHTHHAVEIIIKLFQTMKNKL